jgi:hypothetical protein
MKKKKPEKMLDVNISYSRCVVQVLGMDTNCPMCKALVKSGERHECGGGKKP